MAIHRGIQSVIFFYLSCAPCIEARNTRRRKKAAELALLEALDKKRSGSTEGSSHVTIQPHHTNPAWDLEIAIGPGKEAVELARHRAKNDGRPSSRGSITTKSGWKCSIPDSELDARIDWAKTFQRDDDPLRPYYRHPQMTYANAASAMPDESRITPGGTYMDLYTYPPMDELFPSSSPPSTITKPKPLPTSAPASIADQVSQTPQESSQPKGLLKRPSPPNALNRSLQMPAEPPKVLRFRRPKDRESESSDYFFPGSSESSAMNTLQMPKKPSGSSSKENHMATFTFPVPPKLPQANPWLNDLHPPTVTKVDHPAEVAWMREPPPPITKRSTSAHGKAHIYRSPSARSRDDTAGPPTLRVVSPPAKRSPGGDMPHLRRRDSGTSSDW